MLRRLRIRRDDRPLAVPFTISRGTRTTAELLVVELEQRGYIGRGEAAPNPRYDETPESCTKQLEGLRGAIEAGLSRGDLLTALPAGSARNALDCAMWDLEARLQGQTAARLAGVPRRSSLITAQTIGVGSPDSMGLAAAAMADVPLLKVKVDADDPGLQLRMVRAAAPKPRLIVDANEAWSFDMLVAMLPLLADLGVDLLEQPLPAGEDARLEELRPQTPICADESCHTVDDLDRLAGRYQAVNIKLDKTGGLTAALELMIEARRAGLQVMTGCMICSSLSIAPAFLVAGQSDFVDLDGPLWLGQDYAGGVSLENGRLTIPSGELWGN